MVVFYTPDSVDLERQYFALCHTGASVSCALDLQVRIVKAQVGLAKPAVRRYHLEAHALAVR
jgi:hypothetical protein